MNKNIIVPVAILAVVLVSAGIYFTDKAVDNSISEESPSPSSVENSPLVSNSPKPIISKNPLPTGNGQTSFIDTKVPWNLLLGDASCELKGEIRFVSHDTYDNQDALFIYKGVDHPGRNILWTVSPQEDIQVGPNLFNKTPIPNGDSLLGIVLPDNPKYKKYELTAKIQYSRLVDTKGNFVADEFKGTQKFFEKQCSGKTTVILP